MHAVIATGGKQYRVCKGQRLKIEMLDVEEGQAVTFDKVLMISDGDNTKIGAPYVAGATVSATAEVQGRLPKITIIKFRRRKHYRKQAGHRQYYTEVVINDILS